MRTTQQRKAVRAYSVYDWYIIYSSVPCVAMMYGFAMTLKNEIVKIAPRGRVNCIAPGK